MLAPRLTLLLLYSITSVGGAGEAVAANYKKNSELRTLSADYADCVIKKPNRQALAKDFVTQDLPSDSLRKRPFSSLIDGECLIKKSAAYGGIVMAFPGELYRYALAGALVRRDFGTVPVPSFSAVLPLSHQPMPVMDETKLPKNEKKAAEAKENFGNATMAAFMARYSECVVRQNPSASHALLMATVASAQEKQAFGALHDALGDCMPTGSTVRFGKENLRGSLAVAYYRLADAAIKLAAPVQEQPDA
jgi:hypothetical protein